MPDNGIKLFAAGGHKLPDAVEHEVEEGRDVVGARPAQARHPLVRGSWFDVAKSRTAWVCASTTSPVGPGRVDIGIRFCGAGEPQEVRRSSRSSICPVRTPVRIERATAMSWGTCGLVTE